MKKSWLTFSWSTPNGEHNLMRSNQKWQAQIISVFWLCLERSRVCCHMTSETSDINTVQPRWVDRSKFYWEILFYIYLYSFIPILLSRSWLLAAHTLPVTATIHTQMRSLVSTSISCSCTGANCLSSVSQRWAPHLQWKCLVLMWLIAVSLS